MDDRVAVGSFDIIRTMEHNAIEIYDWPAVKDYKSITPGREHQLTGLHTHFPENRLFEQWL
jgi:hypothetical protein